MRTFLLVIVGWIAGYFLGSAILRTMNAFGVDVSNMSFIILLLPYLVALILAIALPVIGSKTRNG